MGQGQGEIPLPPGMKRLRKNPLGVGERLQKHPSAAEADQFCWLDWHPFKADGARGFSAKQAAEKLPASGNGAKEGVAGAKSPRSFCGLYWPGSSRALVTKLIAQGFSAACEAHVRFADFIGPAQAVPLLQNSSHSVFPQPVKPTFVLQTLVARLKSCPFKTGGPQSFSAACEAHVHYSRYGNAATGGWAAWPVSTLKRSKS